MARTVVMIHPGGLGDVLLAVQAMSRLRTRFPKHRLVLCAEDQVARLLGCASEEGAQASLDALFTAAQPLGLKHAASCWVYGLRPEKRPEIQCVARARRLPDGTYFLLVGEETDAPILRYHTATQLLLDLVDALPTLRKVAGHGIQRAQIGPGRVHTRVELPRDAGTRTSGLRFFSDQAIAVGAS